MATESATPTLPPTDTKILEQPIESKDKMEPEAKQTEEIPVPKQTESGLESTKIAEENPATESADKTLQVQPKTEDVLPVETEENPKENYATKEKPKEKNTEDSKPKENYATKEKPKEVAPPKADSRQNNIQKAVEQSLVKANNAKIGKSPSSKTLKPETKGDSMSSD